MAVTWTVALWNGATLDRRTLGAANKFLARVARQRIDDITRPMMWNDMVHFWRLLQIPPFKTVRAEVACIVCFFFHVKCCPVLGVCRRKCAARLPSALPRTDEGARAGAPFAQTCSFQSVSVNNWKKNVLHVARLESTGTVFLFQLRTGEPDNRIHKANL